MEPEYESGRTDYPYHYVRWTQKRNLSSFLQLLADGKVRIKPMLGGAFSISAAQQAYDSLYDGSLNGIAALLEYPSSSSGVPVSRTVRYNRQAITDGVIRLGVIGCGNFTRSTHLPNVHKNPEFGLSAIASSTGVNALSVAEKFKAAYSTTDYGELIADDKIDAVLIATRHNLHAEIACEALRAGKHVFLEKPAALNDAQFAELEKAISESGAVFMLGYNRRYAPLAAKMKSLVNDNLPLIIEYRVCVPEIPADHWTLDLEEGGGRLVGEAEHFFDFANFLTGQSPQRIGARCILADSETVDTQYNFCVDLEYTARKALATISYTSYAPAGMPRETVTIYQGGQSLVMKDFRELHHQSSRLKKYRNVFADMGHKTELEEFATRIRSSDNQGVQDLLAASRISLAAMADLRRRSS
jgi:predicted dehydrogenase